MPHDRRVTWVALTGDRSQPSLKRIRTDRDAYLRQRLASSCRPRTGPPCRQPLPLLAALADERRRVSAEQRQQHVRLAAPVAELPAVLRRPGRLAGRHLDADRGPGLAGAPAHRQRHAARPRHGLPVPAGDCSSARSAAWSSIASTPAGSSSSPRWLRGALALVLGVLTVTDAVQLWMVFVRRRRPRLRHRRRQPGPPDVRARARRSRAREQRHHAQQRQHQRRPRGRAGHRRAS